MGERRGGEEAAPIAASVATFENLPDDVLGIVLSHLDVGEILQLGQLSRGFQHRIRSFAIPHYISRHPLSYLTLSTPASLWDTYSLLRHNVTVNRNISKHRWHALQVGQTWSQPAIPALHLTGDHLVLGAGTKLLIHPLRDPPSRSHGKSRSVARGVEYQVAPKWVGSSADIVGIAEMADGQLCIAQYDGTLQRFRRPIFGQPLKSTARYLHSEGSSLHTFASDQDHLMTTTSSGLVSLWKANSPWLPPSTLTLDAGTRTWSSLLAINRNISPVAMIGQNGHIAIHPVSSSTLSPTPSRRLCGPDPPQSSSPYDLCLPPSPSSHHPSLLLSAWYDSHLRLHDLRSPSPAPVSSFFDPWIWADGSAMYACTYLGGSYIAGGGARHGTVSFFDTRKANGGWSCFSPGGKGSPVYALKGEGGRVWGVTEKRAFVLAFDGSGDVEEGLVLHEARARATKAVDRPNGYKGRGGKWNWTVRYPDRGERDAQEGAVGYLHTERTVNIFDSLVAA